MTSTSRRRARPASRPGSGGSVKYHPRQSHQGRGIPERTCNLDFASAKLALPGLRQLRSFECSGSFGRWGACLEYQ